MDPRTENKVKNLICLWCGKETTGKKSIDTQEHIFPEAIGGEEKLYIGAVCKDCHRRLNPLDKALKFEHPAMMYAYQIDNEIKGKKISGNSPDKIAERERRKKEKNDIWGSGEAKSTNVRSSEDSICLLNANYETATKNFIRSLHKCAANMLCALYGSVYVRKNFCELLSFVDDRGGDARPWSYAVSYCLSKIPKNEWISLIIKTSNGVGKVIVFTHTSGIWMVGSLPFMLNRWHIEKSSDSILDTWAEREPKKLITDYFGFKGHVDGREYIGKLSFLWVVKEINGTPDSSFLYILTKCKICGQTNPTGFNIARDELLKKKYQHSFTLNDYTWNDVDGRTSDELLDDVKKMPINSCEVKCINCDNMIKFSAVDCFV